MTKVNELPETNKLKITTETHKEFDLPYYCKSSEYNFYKVVSQEKVIDVELYDHDAGISHKAVWSLRSTLIDSTHCTEQEFNEAHQKALAVIGGKVNQRMLDTLGIISDLKEKGEVIFKNEGVFNLVKIAVAQAEGGSTL